MRFTPNPYIRSPGREKRPPNIPELSFKRPETAETREMSKRREEIKRLKQKQKEQESLGYLPAKPASVRSVRVSSPTALDSPGLDLKRRRSLAQVFSRFDLDSNGVISSRELKTLGTARRTLGQKETSWTEAKNLKLLRRMDLNDDGEVDKIEFVHHFNEALPRDEAEFNAIIAQFMACAAHCSSGK